MIHTTLVVIAVGLTIFATVLMVRRVGTPKVRLYILAVVLFLATFIDAFTEHHQLFEWLYNFVIATLALLVGGLVVECQTDKH